jgi:hypothetical protein
MTLNGNGLAGFISGCGLRLLPPLFSTSLSSYYIMGLFKEGHVGTCPKLAPITCRHLLVEIHKLGAMRLKVTVTVYPLRRAVRVSPVCQQKLKGLSLRVRKAQRCCPSYCTCHRVVISLLTQETRYPIVYCILILPLSIVRWIHASFKGKGPDDIWPGPIPTLIVICIFSLSGVANALLYLQTRKRLFQPDEWSDPQAPSINRGEQR